MALSHDIGSALRSVGANWKQAKRRADKDDRVRSRDLATMRHAHREETIRDVAFDVMEEAYMMASGNNRYYANARQIMYAARPQILDELPHREFDDKYFTQTLLKDYLEECRPDWKVVWDDRGHIREPHTRTVVGLGGVAVAHHVRSWWKPGDAAEHAEHVGRNAAAGRLDSVGPTLRYAAILFVEKEGFAPILEAAGIAERFDIAIMSTKGVPVKAACDLLAAAERMGVRVFAIRDFDLAGFKIVRTIREGTRLARGCQAVDLGLRLEDVEHLDLEGEPVIYKQRKDPRQYLRCQCDATEDEADYLVQERSASGGQWMGSRVELNALTSDRLIHWLEGKLIAAGVKKVVPNDEQLAAAHRRAVCLREVERAEQRIVAEFRDRQIQVPDDLRERIERKLKKNPALSWDEALRQVVEETGGR